MVGAVTSDSSSVVDCGLPEPWSAVCKMGVMPAQGRGFHEGDNFVECQKSSTVEASTALVLFNLEAGSGRKDLLTSFAQRLGSLSL